MYVDNINEILNDILDKVYSEGKKLAKEKATKVEIEKFISKFMKSYENDKLNLYTDKNIKNILLKTFEKYVLYYILINVSNNYSLKVFTNLLLSFNNNAIFNSVLLESKTTVDQLFHISKNIAHINNGKIILDSSYINSIQIYNDLGNIFSSNMKAQDIYHSVLKYILFKQVFLQYDKAEIFSATEEYELELLETKYIEIVESTSQEINYISLEKLLNDKEYDNAFINDTYDMLMNDDEEENFTLDEKIEKIFGNNLLIPITDDFLRYNKDMETYDDSTNIDANIKSNKKNNTKIKYIINKMNDVIDYYKNKNNKHFYQPLYYRKAVLINNAEEMDIIKKINNTQNKSDEQISHYEEIILLRKYPYQNFRDFKKNGFQLENKKITESIRYSNIEFLNDPKYDFVKYNNIDWRIMTTENHQNIVGVAVPSKLGKKSFLCSTVDKLTNMSGKHSNILNSLKLLKSQIIMNKQNDDIQYWIFDKKNDLIKKFNEIENFPQDEFYKYIMGYIYDEIAEMTYEKIINELHKYTFESFYDSFNFIESIENELLPITNNKRYNIYKYLIEKKAPDHEDVYDLKDDYIPGITSKLIPIKTPIIHKEKKRNELILYDDKKNIEDINDIYENSQCQHFITWDRIKSLRRKFPNHFNNKLRTFIKEFVKESNNEFYCKSCHEAVELKKYLSDWTSSTEEGITMTFSLHTTLENISEYEKYNLSIKNIEKILEKISGSIGLMYFIGSKTNIKLKRQEVIKMIIDLVTVQHKMMNKMSVEDRKRRALQSEKNYGISSQLSRFFTFELKNEIFTFTSNEIDKFKKLKVNNIVSYMIILLLNEMTSNIIELIPNEKTLNYYIFERIGFDIFNNMYVRINSNNDVASMKEYKLLCYVIFILSGIVVKYNMWFGETMDKKDINITDQKIVINTVVDLLNNILEKNTNPDKDIVYESFSVGFFRKLKNVYTNKMSKDILKLLKEQSSSKISVLGNNKIVFKTFNEKEIELKPYFEINNFGDFGWSKHPQGHMFKKFKQQKNYKDFYTDKEYNNLIKSLDTNKEITKKDIQINNVSEEKINFEYEFKNQKTCLYEHIEKTITNWENIIGTNVKINNQNLYLRHDVYTIDHDYHGNKIDKPLIFIETDNKIIFKKNDSFFDMNVYYYFNKDKNIYMFYNAQTYNYMGYKDNKDYHNVFGSNNGLIPILSIKNKLLFMAFENINYSIPKDIENLLNSDITISKGKLKTFISNIIRRRILNLKNTLLNIQRILYQITNNNKKLRTEPIANKFHSKFKNLVMKKDNKKVFHNITETNNSSYFRKLDDDLKITFDKEYLHVSNLIKIHNTDHDLIMYICDEFNNFIDINDDKYSKITLIYLFCNIIHQEYNFHNKREYITTFTDVKRFILMESNIYNKIEQNESDIFANKTEEEIEEIEENLYSEQEKNDAIDIDIEEDEHGVSDQLSSSYLGGIIDD